MLTICLYSFRPWLDAQRGATSLAKKNIDSLTESHSTCRDIDGSFGYECDPGYENDPINGECRVVFTPMPVEEQNTNKYPENSKRQGN